MLARLRELLRHGPILGVVGSLAIHGLLLLLALFVTVPSARYTVKRGEPLFVELPELPEPAPAGNPAARTIGPPAAKAVAPRGAPRAVRPPSQPPVVAARPAPPTPTRPSSPLPESRRQDVVDAPKPTPQPPAASQEPTPEASPAVQPPASPPLAEATTPAPEPGPQVAALPPDGAVDIRSALGRGEGAGGLKGAGRGGIEGEPIPLDSSNPKFDDFLDRLRRRIKAHWGFPCIKNDTTRACDYKTTSLVVEFGLLKDGRLQFVEVVRSSGFSIYDDYAVNAIKLASPFPAVPQAMIIAMKPGSTGVAILARFNYVVDTSLTNLLR